MVYDFPAHLSPSQINSLTTCGMQYRLTRGEHVPERPTMGGTGGSAVHTLTEEIDRALVTEGRIYSEEEIRQAWPAHYDEAIAENEKSGFTVDQFYCGGRPSAKWPNKENIDWWNHHGPAFVLAWQAWLETSGYDIAQVPSIDTGEWIPAIEIDTPFRTPSGLEVKSIIDRVLINRSTGHHLVCDIKTGSMTPSWPMQMAYNGYGMFQCYDILPEWSGYWKARKGTVPEWYNMNDFLGEQFLIDQAETAQRIKANGLFLAVPSNLCNSACGVKDYCPVYKNPTTPTTDEVSND